MTVISISICLVRDAPPCRRVFAPPCIPTYRLRLSYSPSIQLSIRKNEMKFDLPAPFGPMRAVRGPKEKSMQAATVLNPFIVILSSRFPMFIQPLPAHPTADRSSRCAEADSSRQCAHRFAVSATVPLIASRNRCPPAVRSPCGVRYGSQPPAACRGLTIGRVGTVPSVAVAFTSACCSVGKPKGRSRAGVQPACAPHPSYS